MDETVHHASHQPSTKSGFNCLGKAQTATSLRKKITDNIGHMGAKKKKACLNLDSKKNTNSASDAYLPKELVVEHPPVVPDPPQKVPRDLNRKGSYKDTANYSTTTRNISEPTHDEKLVNPLYEAYNKQASGKQNLESVPPPPPPPAPRGQNEILDLGPWADTGLSSPSDLEVGSMVEILIHGVAHYGVIRWIGRVHECDTKNLVAGVEMEEEDNSYCDGLFRGHRYFECTPNKGVFVYLNHCLMDSRFIECPTLPEKRLSASFGTVECPSVQGDIAPVSCTGDLASICGKNKGIQGHHNSCYLDATLFSMFTFTPIFDSLLDRPRMEMDIEQYDNVQRVLKFEIVNPLRKNMYVRADRVMKLRMLLEDLGSVTGLTSEEKDPEEFLNSLLQQILKAEPYLKLSSGQESYYYQLFVEKDEKLSLPSVQYLVQQSFLASDIKLKEVPPCLIILMPRFGKQYKVYQKIFPTPYLDVTEIIENSPRVCSVCGGLAYKECKDCFKECKDQEIPMIAFCKKCAATAHKNPSRAHHKLLGIKIPDEYLELLGECQDTSISNQSIPHLYMELFAVVCIETSHYVAFVKSNSGPDAPWCFFDSMADRRGEQNGYNIPEVVPCKELNYWLSEPGYADILSGSSTPPDYVKRLLSDAYLCMYQSLDVMMYR